MTLQLAYGVLSVRQWEMSMQPIIKLSALTQRFWGSNS